MNSSDFVLPHDSAALVSDQVIGTDELVDFLKSLRGYEVDRKTYGLQRGEATFWIFIGPNGLSDVLSGTPLSDLSNALGGEPLSAFILEIPSRPGSDRLVAEFACEFLSKWNGVLDDYDGTLYSLSDLRAQLAETSMNLLAST